ncbi:MAG: putative ABC transporter ATP-binding protein [Candidatus Heimdallarchaeota archaeon LC_3]|nr:MAG: putative ABC transporter ATP-binding protein [Candidatus Heimdallarchaeota archaeon LC_3]
MTTKAESPQTSVFSTMLISKPHRRANYALRRRLLLIMKQPRLSWMNLEGYDIFTKIIAVLGGLILALVITNIGSGINYGFHFITGDIDQQFQWFEITGNSLPVILVLFIIGAFLTNKTFQWWVDRPVGTVAELNTFIIAQMQPLSSKFEVEEERIKYETKIQMAHRKYKRKLLKQLQSHIANDFELKNSRKILVDVAKSLKSSGTKEEIKAEVDEVLDWAWSTLDHVHKGSRLTYWDNVSGIDRLIISDHLNQKQLIEIEAEAEGIVDELNLLVFANRYSSVMLPLLQQSVKFSKAFEEHCCTPKFVETFQKGEKHDENFAEAYRVLLSKSLGMQEVLKSTVRQFDRMREAKEELIKEAQALNLPKLELIANEFVTEEAFQSYLEMIEHLRESLSHVAKDLRKLNFKQFPKGTRKDLKFITRFYLVLEKLRFITTWFEDIASYTTVVGGIGYETGVITSQSEIEKDVVLKVEDIFKNYHTGGGTIYALRGVSFEIKKGEFVGVIGPSGSGKTTLLNIMAGLDNPDRGAVYVDGMNLQSLNDKQLTSLRRDKMGFIFQFYNLIPMLTNKENVAYPAEVGGNTKDLSNRVSNKLKSVQLEQFERQYPNKLSGGQMQRVTIARSLINTPSILFADEPTGDLDSVTGEEIMNLLSSFNKEHETTVIMVTHDRSLLKYCNRIIDMKDGRLIEELP